MSSLRTPPAATGHDTAKPASPNIFIFGKPGRGKGATAKQIALQRLATQARRLTRVVHDPAGEYTNLARSFGGELVQPRWAATLLLGGRGWEKMMLRQIGLFRQNTAPQVLATHTLDDLAPARTAHSAARDAAEICRACSSPQAVASDSLADTAVAGPARSTQSTPSTGEW